MEVNRRSADFNHPKPPTNPQCNSFGLISKIGWTGQTHPNRDNTEAHKNHGKNTKTKNTKPIKLSAELIHTVRKSKGTSL